MWKYLRLIFGALFLLSAANGFSGNLNKSALEALERIDKGGIDTIGTIERRVENIVGVKIGRIPAGTIYYTIYYNFTTADGRKLGDSVDVSRQEAYGTQDGEAIRIRYYEQNPTINSALDYQTFATMDEATTAEMSSDIRIVSIVSLFLGLGLFVWGGSGIYSIHSGRNANVKSELKPAKTSRRIGSMNQPNTFGRR